MGRGGIRFQNPRWRRERWSPLGIAKPWLQVVKILPNVT